MKKRLLVFHPALAPYRIDFFNECYRNFNSTIYFSHKNVLDQKFDQAYLHSLLQFAPFFITRGFEFFGRTCRFGVIYRIFKHQPDIVITSEFGQITVISFLVRFFCRYKLYTLCDDSLDNAIQRRGVRSYLRNLISKNIDGVIYASKEVAKWNVQNVSGKIKTLELPIIHKDEVFRDKLYSSLHISENNFLRYELQGKRIILFVGRLVEVKNIPFLIRAYSLAKKHDSLLVIVGSGPLEHSLKELIINNDLANDVLFTGRLEGLELYSWFAVAQIFVLPSTHERYGAVVNEALLGGCHVLISSLAGAANLINSDNGDIFDPFDIDDLKLKMSKAINSVQPLSMDNICLRENKMPFKFDDKVNALINAL